MIEHSVFALPFAYIAALTAMWQQSRSVHWVQLALITVAMVSARTVAMSANRILDRRFDALNPRTRNANWSPARCPCARRGSGRSSRFAVFLASAAALSWLCLALAPIAVALLVLYSYGKRFTDVPQLLLALAQFVAPVGAWLAVTGGTGAAPIALGVAVGTWIGGFDLIYSCQDAEIDRVIGSRSFPARFGVRAALWASAAVHLVTFGAFAWFGAAAGTRPVVVDGPRADRGRPRVRARDRPAAATCHGSTGRSSPRTASSASACSASPSPTSWCRG